MFLHVMETMQPLKQIVGLYKLKLWLPLMKTWEPGWTKVKSLSRVQLFATPGAHQAPPSVGFSRQENWSGLPFTSPGDLPDPGIEPGFPALQADALPSEPPGKTQRTRVLRYKTGMGTYFILQINLHCFNLY